MRIMIPEELEMPLQRVATAAGYRHVTVWLREQGLPSLIEQNQKAEEVASEKARSAAPE